MSNKRSVWNGWIDLGSDMSWEDYGGKWGFKAPDGSWYVIRFENLEECLGRDFEGSGLDRYMAEVKRVDLRDVSLDTIESALNSCGITSEDLEDMGDNAEQALVEALDGYGASAPMSEHSDPSYPARAMAAARRHAEDLMRDSDALENALDRPVNMLGSTAREYARGDFQSALERGVHAGNPSARLMAKMHGVDQTVIDDARPADFLPYFMGYMAGKGGDDPERDDDLAPEYHQGYERGVRVRKGEAPAPSWIREG